MKSRLLPLLIVACFTTSASASLVAHFSFDDENDLGANTGSVNTTWNSFNNVDLIPEGRFGSAASFVANSSQAWDNSFSVANLQSFSLSMHVRTTQTTAWRDFISIGTGNNVVFVLEQTGASGISVFNIGGVGGTTEGQVGYNPGSETWAVNDGQWHHLGITVGGGTITLYVNGINRDSASYSGTGAISAFQLASRFGDGGRSITTDLDDIGIFNTTLSDSDMAWLSQNAIPEPATALLSLIGIAALMRRRR